MTKSRLKDILFLHLLLLLFSFSALCAKFAASQPFLSPAFIALYSTMLFLLFIYAIFWQQILKRLSLTTAFANRAAVVFWGMIWGRLFFGERVTPVMILAVVVIYIGVMIVVTDKN